MVSMMYTLEHHGSCCFSWGRNPILLRTLAFREKEGDTHIPKQVHGNSVLEIIWTLIPVVLLVFVYTYFQDDHEAVRRAC